jgi:hypothetical protein
MGVLHSSPLKRLPLPILAWNPKRLPVFKSLPTNWSWTAPATCGHRAEAYATHKAWHKAPTPVGFFEWSHDSHKSDGRHKQPDPERRVR